MPWLAVALRALEAYSNRTPWEIILVENPCVDKSPQVAAEFAARDPERRRIITITDPPCPGLGRGPNHGHGLNVAFARVATEWTLFMDADCIPLRNGWLDEMMDAGGDLVGPPAFAPSKARPDYLKGRPHAHPCLMLFRTELGRQWPHGYQLWTVEDHPEIAPDTYWDTAIPFAVDAARRSQLVNLPMQRRSVGGMAYWSIGNGLALHVQRASNRKTASGGQAGNVVIPQKVDLLNLSELDGLR